MSSYDEETPLACSTTFYETSSRNVFLSRNRTIGSYIGKSTAAPFRAVFRPDFRPCL